MSEKVKKGGREEEEEEKMEGACANPTVEEEYDMSHYSSSESEEEGKGKKECWKILLRDVMYVHTYM